MQILKQLRLLRILLHQKNQKLLSFSFFIILLIFIFFVVFFSKNIINENLAYTFLVTTVSLTKNIKYNHIIKRYTKGGKKIGEKAIEKFGENVTKTTASSCPTSTQNPMPKYYTSQKNDNQSTEKTNTTLISNTSNQPQTNIKKENTASSYSNQASKNNFEDKIKNSSKKSEENNNANENETTSIKKFINTENEKIKEDNKKQIPLKEKVIENLFKPMDLQGNTEDIPERKIEDQTPSDPIIIAIDIKSQSPQTPEEKHICLGEQQKDESVIVSAYYTSSAGHSKEKHNYGQPQNKKVSETKIDKSYIPAKQKIPGINEQGDHIVIKREIRIPANDNEDGAGCAVPSTTKGGQYVRKLHKPIKIEKNNYTENDEATKYTQNAEIYKEVVDIHKKVVNTTPTLVEQQDDFNKQYEDDYE